MMLGIKESTSFCEQKEAKKLSYSRPGALAALQPVAQSKRNFLVLFFKKELLPALDF